MGIKRSTRGQPGKFELILKIIPILLSFVGLLFAGYRLVVEHKNTIAEEQSWILKKEILADVQTLSGRIYAARDNDSLLRIYLLEFESHLSGDMKLAGGKDSLLMLRMLSVQKDIKNSLLHQDDFYQNNKLGKSCKQLSDQLTEAIEKGDKQF
ncbi:hypothetical protein GZH53_15785 [Flavihumibacter sp. R14]|nr:hypothetical protein [Flavihumibacter soli]